MKYLQSEPFNIPPLSEEGRKQYDRIFRETTLAKGRKKIKCMRCGGFIAGELTNTDIAEFKKSHQDR